MTAAPPDEPGPVPLPGTVPAPPAPPREVAAPIARRPGAARIPVIVNATAGRKAGIATNEPIEPPDIEALFALVGLAVEVHPTESEADAIEVTRSAIEAGCPAVVAAGGDGTFGLVARTILAAGAEGPEAQDRELPAVGVLPLGSVMNVARSLDIPRDLPAAASIVADGHSRLIDVGMVTGGQAFFEALAIGLHAELFAEAEAFDDGDWRAALRAAWTALRYRPSRLRLVLDDGVVSTRALVVSVSNGPYAGLAFTVAPDARLDDGLFDVRVFERFSRWELLRHFGSIALGRRAYEPRVRTWRSGRVRVESASPLQVRADGDDAGATPIEATVLPAALRVLVPSP